MRKHWWKKPVTLPWLTKVNRELQLNHVTRLHAKLFRRCLSGKSFTRPVMDDGGYVRKKGERHDPTCRCIECGQQDLGFVELVEYHLRGGDYQTNCGKEEHEKEDTCCEQKKLEPYHVEQARYRHLRWIARKWQYKFPQGWSAFAGV